MLDTDLADALSPQIGRHYREALTHIEAVPAHALSQLRACAHLICDSLAKGISLPASAARDLGRKIEYLLQRGVINTSIENLLETLRINGNKGVHPEKFVLAPQQLGELAHESLSAAQRLLEICFRRHYPNQILAKVENSNLKLINIQGIIYQAAVERDPESCYIAGKWLLSKIKEHAPAIDANDYTETIDQMLSNQALREQAILWLNHGSSAQHMPSTYEYGQLLAQCFAGEEKISLGEGLIYKAAQKGHVEAQNQMGAYHLYGSKIFEKDLVEARKYFELAASDDNPMALAQLGYMYKHGWGGPKDEIAALECTKKSAEAGYPQGQYNFFVHLWDDGLSTEQNSTAFSWLQKAVKQNFPEALLTMANLIRSNMINGKNFSDAEKLYEQCLHYPETSSKARVELAKHYFYSSREFKHLLIAAALIQECYEREKGEGKLSQECLSISPSLITKIRNELAGFALDHKTFENAFLVLQYFDQNGRPCLNRMTKSREIYNNIMNISKKIRSKNHPIQNDPGILLQNFTNLPTVNFLNHFKNIKEHSLYTKVGRNEKCPCNSGKKYKHCCSG
ncbi:SEC-C metal-binding domain-containing protein [Azohydromonas lata]|uniref:DUF4145 domain-containing protein n=1 Tax=Azohydromonas lata TaxID=45677 RepID=A0ABU5I981_9BURK|nr:DUF4145 domain-containing protein [Azohydromonas lata]MDZ5455657.1 DUF4145 domain-containing protein [Azohydromonas lata]